MSKQQEMPQFIMDFVKEISDSPDLYLSFFSERQALTDATRIMREQKSELATLRRELAVHKRALFDACLRISALQYKINRKKSCPAEVLGKCQESEMRPNCSPAECWQTMFVRNGRDLVGEQEREEAAELEAAYGKD